MRNSLDLETLLDKVDNINVKNKHCVPWLYNSERIHVYMSTCNKIMCIWIVNGYSLFAVGFQKTILYTAYCRGGFSTSIGSREKSKILMKCICFFCISYNFYGIHMQYSRSGSIESNINNKLTVLKARNTTSVQPKSLHKIKFENLPHNMFMTFNPVFDSATHHDLLLLAQTIWISVCGWRLERRAPISLSGE